MSKKGGLGDPWNPRATWPRPILNTRVASPGLGLGNKNALAGGHRFGLDNVMKRD